MIRNDIGINHSTTPYSKGGPESCFNEMARLRMNIDFKTTNSLDTLKYMNEYEARKARLEDMKAEYSELEASYNELVNSELGQKYLNLQKEKKDIEDKNRQLFEENPNAKELNPNSAELKYRGEIDSIKACGREIEDLKTRMNDLKKNIDNEASIIEQCDDMRIKSHEILSGGLDLNI